MTTSLDSDHPRQEILDELHALGALVVEAERTMAAPPSERRAESLGQLRTRFGAARGRIADLCGRAKQNLVVGARRTDETIRANPYQSLAVAAAVGLLVGAAVGLLIGRRDR